MELSNIHEKDATTTAALLRQRAACWRRAYSQSS